MKTKIGIQNFFIPSILIVLAVAFILRIVMSPFGTLSIDQNTFYAWSLRLASVGFGKFYFGAWSDYLPGYLYVLALLARINETNIIPLTILYKLPAIFSDIGTGYLIYLIVIKLKSKKWALISSSLYLFNPAIFANSALWGQVDGFTAFFSLLTLWALDINLYLSAAALAIGTLIKPQMAVISLIILFMMLQRKYDVKKIITYIVSSAAVFIAGFIPFSGGTNLLTFIVTRMNISLNQYPYTSVNAFNFWGIFGGWKPDTGLNIAGGIFVLVLFFVIGLKFLKQKGGEYILLAFTYSLMFLFMTRMHERHLLPAFAPLTIAVALNPVFIFALVGFSFIYLANLYWAWVWVTNSFQQAFSDSIVKLLSIIDVLLISVFLIPKKFDGYATNFKNSFLRSRQTSWPVTSFLGNSSSFEEKNNKSENARFLNEPKISSQKIKIMFVGVIVFASVARLFNLGNPPNNYFDEVYHAFTAQSMLHGVTKAWEWWNPNPTGFAYEWTHPPLAKEGMVLGMSLLGENSFGWRFPGAMLGIGSVILIFFIAKEIFDDDLLALIASAVLSLDGLALVLSRIGMNDSYMLFFALASVYSYLKKRNFWAAVFFGLSVASKWSGLWVAPIILVAHFVFKRKFNWSYLFLFILPPIIYISSYFPIFTSKQIQAEYIQNTGYEQRTDKVGIVPLDMFIDVQKQMWWYHTRLKATHPYSSMWYTWPFLVRPIYLYTSNEIDNSVSRIYAMGNPIVFWGGTAAIVATAYVAFRERNKKLGFVVFAYLVFFTPWAISPRIMFLYHYLPSIPFMAIATAYVLRRFKEFRIPFLVIALITFIYFYPHYAGLTIPLQLDSSYYWFTSWR